MLKYRIERVSSENIKHLQVLYREVFRRRVSLEFLWKKYDTKFSGAEFIGYLAFGPDGSPAAFYGVLPCRFRLNGETILAAQSADTMTHPLHRRQGLFMRLAKETYKLGRQNAIELIFGFPNQNSMPGFEKINWEFLPEPLKLFRFPVKAFAFSKIIRRIPAIRETAYRSRIRDQLIDGRNVDFFANCGDGVIRDAAFVNYKRYSDSYFIQIDAIPVWLKPDGALKIGYVGIKGEIHAQDFIKKISKIASLTGCSEVIFMTSANSSLFNLLRTLTAAESAFPIGLYSISNRKWNFSNLQFEYCDIDIF